MFRNGSPNRFYSLRTLWPRAQSAMKAATSIPHRWALARCRAPSRRTAPRRSHHVTGRVAILEPPGSLLME
jgi:hypothetical protein